MTNIRFSKFRASEIISISETTGCAASAHRTNARLGINVVPAKAYQTMQTKPKYTGRANCTSMYPQHASDNKSIFDSSNMVSFCNCGNWQQGEIMNEIIRKTSYIRVLHYGAIPINYETILKEARCK